MLFFTKKPHVSAILVCVGLMSLLGGCVQIGGAATDSDLVYNVKLPLKFPCKDQGLRARWLTSTRAITNVLYVGNADDPANHNGNIEPNMSGDETEINSRTDLEAAVYFMMINGPKFDHLKFFVSNNVKFDYHTDKDWHLPAITKGIWKIDKIATTDPECGSVYTIKGNKLNGFEEACWKFSRAPDTDLKAYDYIWYKYIDKVRSEEGRYFDENNTAYIEEIANRHGEKIATTAYYQFEDGHHCGEKLSVLFDPSFKQ